MSEYQNGYEAAVAAMKAAASGRQNGSGTGNTTLPPGMLPIPNQLQGKNSQGQKPDGQNQPTHGAGQERPSSPAELDNVPKTPGAMIDPKTGAKIAESEGYPSDTPSESTIDVQWKQRIEQTKKQLKQWGKKGGEELVRILDSIWRTSTDWKKLLRDVVGHSITPDDPRRAFANKNLLAISGGERIARTDKDKYDAMDYVAVFFDTSGSMTNDEFRTMIAEIYSLALMKKPLRLLVIQCDTRITDVQVFNGLAEMRKGLRKMDLKGGGGTELAPCWNFLKTDPRFKRAMADLVLVMTDGGLTQYRRDPRTMKNLCWVILDNPSFNVQYPDARTKCIYINPKDIN